MTSGTRVALIHAYSSRNAGDGLLVDLSVALLKEAFGDATRVSIVAADPASFPQYPDVHAAPVLAERGIQRLIGAAGASLPVGVNPRVRTLRRVLDSADVIAGVGGGYLRARNCLEALKLEAGHLQQMRATALADKPTVYLPQSIGPSMPAQPLHAHMAALLRRFSSVFVRDDRSALFLAGNGNTKRAPDLAVLDFLRRSENIMARAENAHPVMRRVAFVLRRAPSWSDAQRVRYATATRRLIDTIGAQCEIVYAVQSTGRGNDDLAYYRSIGVDGPLMSLKDLLANDPPDGVVSVRLHGALEAILHGVPAYHLSYERKGFGAYADLGIGDWVANAADFDADHAAKTILAPGAIHDFWSSAKGGFARIRKGREQVIASLRAARNA